MEIEENIKEKAQYCLKCKMKPCSKACPMHTNIPEFISEIVDNNLEKAYEILDKLVNKKLKEELLSKNFDKIINNEDIEAYKILDTSTFFKKERIK